MKISSSEDLRKTFERIKNYAPRFGVNDVINFILNENLPVICGVIGLKSTGKSTILWHAMQRLPPEIQARSLYLEAESGDDVTDLTNCIEKFSKNGYSIFFVDEITNIKNLSDNGASLANTYPARGLKIIISGTDSLLLSITERSVFYNKILPVRTTWMPWREYERIMSAVNNNNFSFDDYLENGGILFNNVDNETNIEWYVRTAIIDNLINSLDNDGNGKNYGELCEFRNRGKLKDFVLRVINDNTHRFIINLLTEKYSLNEFESASAFMRSKFPGLDKNRLKLALDRVIYSALKGEASSGAGFKPVPARCS